MDKMEILEQIKKDIQQAFKEYSSETESDAISGTIQELTQEYIENLKIHQKSNVQNFRAN